MVFFSENVCLKLELSEYFSVSDGKLPEAAPPLWMCEDVLVLEDQQELLSR